MMRAALIVALLAVVARPAVAQPLVFLDRFEYDVPRDSADKAPPFRAAGWADVKSEPVRGKGYLYTRRYADLSGGCQQSPDGSARVLAIEARPATLGGQTDFWLQLGSPGPSIPGDVWLQFDECNPTTFPSLWGARNKFLYVSGDGVYPSHSHKWMIWDNAYTYQPRNESPFGNPASGRHVWGFGSADGVTTMRYTGPSADPDNNNQFGPQTLGIYSLAGQWVRTKIHVNTTTTRGSRFEMWQRTLGPVPGPWVKTHEFIDGQGGFEWIIPADSVGGHRSLRMPTTVGHATSTAQQFDYLKYLDNFAMATTEAALPGEALPPPPPTPIDCAGTWGAWTRQQGSETACVNGSRTFIESRLFTVAVPPSNGGAACPSSPESRTATEACTMPPPPVDTCVSAPLVVTSIAWPGSAEGSRSGRFSWSVAGLVVTLQSVEFMWNPQQLRLADSRGCTVTVRR